MLAVLALAIHVEVINLFIKRHWIQIKTNWTSLYSSRNIVLHNTWGEGKVLMGFISQSFKFSCIALTLSSGSEWQTLGQDYGCPSSLLLCKLKQLLRLQPSRYTSFLFCLFLYKYCHVQRFKSTQNVSVILTVPVLFKMHFTNVLRQ